MQTITSETAIPVSNTGTVRIKSLFGGKFRAAIIRRYMYNNDKYMVQQMLNQQDWTMDFVQQVNSPDSDLVLVVKPAGSSLTFQLNAPLQPALYSYRAAREYGVTDTIKTKWSNISTLSKGLIITAIIVVLLLIIWGIWKWSSKKSQNSRMNSTFY